MSLAVQGLGYLLLFALVYGVERVRLGKLKADAAKDFAKARSLKWVNYAILALVFGHSIGSGKHWNFTLAGLAFCLGSDLAASHWQGDRKQGH